jgi:hypothetical protein
LERIGAPLRLHFDEKSLMDLKLWNDENRAKRTPI